MIRATRLEEDHGIPFPFARAALAAAALALALACGSDGSTAPQAAIVEDPGPIDPGPDAGNEVPPPSGCSEVTLRLRGVDPGDLTAFSLDVASTSLAVEGGATFAGLPAQTVDLLTDQAWRLGILPWPDGAPGAGVTATVVLAGGAATTAAGAVAFPACVAPLRIPIDLGRVDPGRCHAVIHLDLARSVAPSAGPTAGGPTFLPSFAIYY